MASKKKAHQLKLEDPIMKSGYLVKLAMGSGRNWKKRYFMLNGNTFTYYVDHKNVDKAKGDLLLTAEATVEESSLPGKPYCIMITTPFHTLVVAAKDTEERDSWRVAIEKSIMVARNSIRGYITKKGSLADGGKSRRFFILHEAAITWHKDHEHTQDIQGMVKLATDTSMICNDEQLKINLTDASTNTNLGLRFEQNANEFAIWKAAIGNILKKFAAAEQATARRIENAYENATKRGKLRKRPEKGGDTWDEYYFVLTMTELLVMDKNADGLMEVVDMFEIHPNCSVFETNLGLYAFELVTPKKVLHVMSDSRESTSAWIHAIRASIVNSSPEENDPLIQAALAKVDEDVFYDVSFLEDKPLGVVLERSGEWAIVKLSNLRDTGVSVGSALTSINGESCVLKTYAQAIERLKNWHPPLHLGFRRAPKKSGYLVKLSRQRRGNSQKNWQHRYFSLDEGRLKYKEQETSSEVKGDVPLMGSAVSLVSSSETGKFFCFRLVSGVTSLVMQGETMDEMMDWASTLYHAIAIANGGSHILNTERARAAEEESRQRAREEVMAARKRAEEAARQAKEEVETRARVEEAARRQAQEAEARRRAALAEEERLKLEAADKKQRKLDTAAAELTSALASMDLCAINAAVAIISASDIAGEVPLLADARAVAVSIAEKEAEKAREKAEAESNLRVAVSTASVATVDALAVAVEAADQTAADSELVNTARDILIDLRKERAVIDEVKSELSVAISFEGMNSLVEALMSAATINLQDPLVEEAQAVLAKLQAAEERRVAEEEARLAAEAAALDAELAVEEAKLERMSEDMKDAAEEEIFNAIGDRATITNVGMDSDEEGRDEDDSEVESDEEEGTVGGGGLVIDSNAVRAAVAAAARHGVTATSMLPTPPAGSRASNIAGLTSLEAKAYVPNVACDGDTSDAVSSQSPGNIAPSTPEPTMQTKPARRSGRISSGRHRAASLRSQGRKLMTRRERLEAEQSAAELRVQDTVVSEAEMKQVFDAYSRINAAGKRTIIPLHFSIIWRLVSGDKGNLFAEMQTFQTQNDGFLDERDFIAGWKAYACKPGGALVVDKMKNLTGEDKVLL